MAIVCRAICRHFVSRFIFLVKYAPNNKPRLSPTGLQGDGLRQDPMATELVGVADGNSDDDDVEDLQSTGNGCIDRLLSLDNMNKEGKLGEVDA